MKPFLTRNGVSHALIWGCLFICSIYLYSCKRTPGTPVVETPAYHPAIAAFTSGTISVHSYIVLKLAEDYTGPVEPGSRLAVNLFEFIPKITGDAYWINSQTIEYRPATSLRSGTNYAVKFNVGKLLDLPEEKQVFEFGFSTVKQSFNVKLERMNSYSGEDLKWNTLSGRILTADVMDREDAEQILSANQGSRKLNIRLEPSENQKEFRFVVDSILRGDNPASFLLQWSGKKIGIEEEGEQKTDIPALGDFRLTEVTIIQQPEQYVSIRFSDPLQKKQDLDGLVRLDNETSLSFTITDNEIRAYPAVRQSGAQKVSIESGIRNILGFRFEHPQEYNVSFDSAKPQLRLIGKGVILPSSKGLMFPFEAINLSAVDVSIIKIFENNIAQFLQVNGLEGEYQLKRAGRLIMKKTIQLTSDRPMDAGEWNTFSLDLSALINPDPGAIYRIELGFKKEYSLYPCQGEEKVAVQEESVESWGESMEEEMSYWDSYEDYYYDDYGYYYDWEERDDPCSLAYYGKHRSISQNILASDLGIIAKGGNDNSMLFAVTDLRTTEPLPGVDLEVYNFQNQQMANVQTNSEGLARISLEAKPFLLIAKQGAQRGYLKLDEGSSLSVSSFDASGDYVQKGMKGYVYGERGVWRPGDTLFLTFLLEDKEKLLPAGHPVSFELVNPLGQVIKKIVKSQGKNGFYNFTTSTAADAPTGNWSARIRVGGTIFYQPLRIETIKPNRLKIKLDFGIDMLSSAHPDIKGLMAVTWLHGAIARNLKAEVLVTLSPMQTKFEKYPEYVFDDPARTFSAVEQPIFNGRINEQGQATVSSSITVQEAAPGMLKASFLTRVFEEGGDASTDRFTLTYSPFISYVGIKTPRGDRARGMLLTDTSHVIQLATINEEGNPVSRSNLRVTVYKIDWKWWWDASEENLANYLESEYNNIIYEGTASTRNGTGQFNFRINYPDWGRYLIHVTDPVSGHSTGQTVYVDWPGWAGRAQREGAGGASILSFSADKTHYNVGETAIIRIPSSGMGRALVSVENGTKVMDARWVETTGTETVFNLKLSAEMTPNIYVHISLLQPHGQTNNDLPIRMYGVIPLFVDDPATRLTPLIQMPDVLRPEEKTNIQVKEKEGKTMTYTLAMVDEGLLDLTRFKTPDPWNVFYAREALGVRTWDMFDQVIGAYGGKIEKIFGIGGDEGLLNPAEQGKATRFKPMVIFLGPFELEKGKTNIHTIRIPKYIGSVRTMVVAGNDGVYGFAEKTVAVRKPLMVLATLPRVLGPAESLKLPVTVFALEPSVKNVSVEVKANDLFRLSGETMKSISFTEPGDQMVYFDLAVTEKTGIGKVQVLASAGSERADYEIEIDVRNPNPELTKVEEAVIDPGSNWTIRYEPIGITGTNKGRIEVSSIPAIDLGRRLKYLISYPHGCLEQVTSAAFPQLFLSDIMEMDETASKRAIHNIQLALDKLRSFALENGSFTLWPGTTDPDDWATSYAGHFMLEAEDRGYTLPAGLRQSWLKYQKKTARNWSPPRGMEQYFDYEQYDLSQAYRLYTLALANEPELGAMNRLRESNNLSNQGKWRLAAAYALAGQRETAMQLIQGIKNDVEEYQGSTFTYGSPTRDRAMILETMTLLGEREKAVDLVKKISAELSGPHWMSTQSAAYSLLAISKFSGKQVGSKEMKYDLTLPGQKTIHATTKMSLAQHELDLSSGEPGTAEIVNKGNGILFARLVLEGIPVAGGSEPIENNLRMTVAYYTMNKEYLDVATITQGTDFMAKVTITNLSQTETVNDMALQQIFPSGWEIRNLRLEGSDNLFAPDAFTYQDIRDDRVYTYFSLGRAESKSFIILLNASYEGRFYLPDTYVEAMYDNRIQARKPGKWVEVLRSVNE